MPSIDELNAGIADATRKHDQIRLGSLRMLKAALMNREIERGQPLSEADSLAVVTTLVKQRKDSIEQFTKGNRPDLAEKESAELHVLEAFLPPAADAEVIDRAIAEAI